MRIGELAALVGVSPRTVRHYHAAAGGAAGERVPGVPAVLATMLSAADLHPDSAVSPEMAQVLRGLPSGGSRFAGLDRGLLAMLDGTADPAARAELVELFRPLTTPEAVARSQDLYRRMDELVDAEPDDPRVAPLAADLASHLPERMAAVMVENLAAGAGRWVTEMAEELSAAQAEVFRLMVIQLKEVS